MALDRNAQCGFDVLAKPLARAELVRAVGHAFQHCERLDVPVTCSIMGHRSGGMVKQRNTVAVCGYFHAV